MLLLDEPDAHLEILRQREIYETLTRVADEMDSQVIAASHSEVLLNEAGSRGLVVAFVGQPHQLNDRGSQVLKALAEIGWEQYYQAEETGWVLYLESASDLAILRTFAEKLNHPVAARLARPFVHYVANLPQKARDHFYGLREAKPDLTGLALFDRIDKELHSGAALNEMMWARNEIENYFCTRDVLLSYARHDQPETDLFSLAESDKRVQAMEEAIREVSEALEKLGKPEPWSNDIKASDDFLEPVFRSFFKKLNLPLGLRKTDYHLLAKFLDKGDIDPEVTEKLDAIVQFTS